MNPDAQLFNETQHSLNEEYLETAIPEPPIARKQPQQSNTFVAPDNHNKTASSTDHGDTNVKEDVTGFANYRFVMSSFELYETKTVSTTPRIPYFSFSFLCFCVCVCVCPFLSSKLETENN